MASSMGMVTLVSISLAEAPGSLAEMVTTGISMLGMYSRETSRPRYTASTTVVKASTLISRCRSAKN